MTGIGAKRASLAAVVILAAAGAFGVLTAFEVWIGQASARADAALSDILAQEHILRIPSTIEVERRDLDRRIASLSLRADALAQEAGFIRLLHEIASRRGVRLLAIRARPFERFPKARSNFEDRAYDVVLEGSYRVVLVALADLSGAPLVTRLGEIDIAKAERAGAPSSWVRAMLQLATVRLATERDVRTHAP